MVLDIILIVLGSVLIPSSAISWYFFEKKISRRSRMNNFDVEQDQSFYITKLIFRTLFTALMVVGLGLIIWGAAVL